MSEKDFCVNTKRGPKPKNKVNICWSENFAYIIGIITSDGSITKNNAIVNVTSKDVEIIENIKKEFSLSNKIGVKGAGGIKEKPYYVIQFGDVNFCKFLNSIGIYSNKSKTIERVDVPDEFFFDFLRGYFDGDGSAYSYFDKRWKSSFMFYISFVSASKKFVDFLRSKINSFSGLSGHLTYVKESTVMQLRYAKKEAILLVDRMYKNRPEFYLNRKRLKIDKILGTIASTSLKS